MARDRINKIEEKWKKLHSLGCFCVFLFYMIGPVNFYLAETTHDVLLVPVAAVLVVLCLVFQRFQDGITARLLAMYWIWICLTRVFNGDKTLSDSYLLLIPLAMCFCFFAVGQVLSIQQREHFLDWFTFAVCLFYAVMGLICLTCMLSGKTILNPITGANLAQAAPEKKVVRLSLLDYHANMSAAVFFIPLSLMIYQFFHCRRHLWRIPITLAFLEYYLCIGLTYSRGTMAAVSFCLALTAILPVLKHIQGKKTIRIMTAVILIIVIAPLVYKSFSWSTAAFGKAAAVYQTKETSREILPDRKNASVLEKTGQERSAVESAAVEETQNAENSTVTFEDNRNLGQELKTLNNRVHLYRAVIVSFREEPIRMLIGSGSTEEMLYYANNVVQTSQHFEHMHNFLLQVLMMTGIPGFLLVLVFCILLAIEAVRLFFSESHSIAEKTLLLPVVGLLMHFMLETGLFTSVDVRGLFFFLMAGFVAGSHSSFLETDTKTDGE